MTRVCFIEGCGNRVIARGWCVKHYNCWKRHGDPLGGSTSYGEAQRFVDEIALTHDGDGCLIWPFFRDKNGYARINRDGENRLAHRIVCEKAHGAPPSPEHEAAHSCGKGHLGCVAPDHLRWDTPKGNSADKLIHDTHIRGARHPHAKLTEEDVRIIRPLLGTMSHAAIGRRFGVSSASIWQVDNGKAWGWVT